MAPGKTIKRQLLSAAGTLADGVLHAAFSVALSDRKLNSILRAAENEQLAAVLNRLGLYDFLRAQRALHRKTPEVQALVLRDILRVNQNTDYGRRHHFDRIRSLEEFRQNVPLTTYEDHQADIERMLHGEENVLFPGKPVYFYRTSGTTSAAKFIPESERETVSRKATTRARYYERILASSVRGVSRVFAMFSRSSDAATPCGIPAGNSSGRTAGNAGGLISRRYAYPPALVEELEGDALYYTMMRLALVDPDMGIISANNAHMLTMLVALAQEHADEIIRDIRNGTNRYPLSEQIRAQAREALKPDPARADALEQLLAKGRFTPRYYWKNLRLASFWLGGSVGVFVDEVRPLLPEKVTYMDVGYGASEAKINIPMTPGTPAGPLALAGAFYEFLPEQGGAPLLAHELEDGKTYEIVLTTYGGLYRYRLEDYVRVEGFTGQTPNICFLSKSSDVANLVEEKIAGVLLAQAIRKAAEQHGLGYRTCQVFPDERQTCYVICLEAAQAPADPAAFAVALDRTLCEEIAIYDIERYSEKMLRPCQLRLMKPGWSDALMEQAAKGRASSAQIKPPVVIRKLPDENWMLNLLIHQQIPESSATC